ncbi:MAG: DUF4115 domain-containing protein [Proteobacteria bacterium]|nr:DUF4115 domain-containing protein [Pseudomonadota bacterium]
MNSDSNIDTNDFRTIREDKGMSVEEVAGRLKLTYDTILKLEESRFSEMGAYIYVQGYIKHYSELLGVDSEKYLALVSRSQMQVPLVNTKANNSKGMKFRRHSKSLASYSLGTFIVVAISFSGWFLLKNYQGISKNNSDDFNIVESNSIEIAPQQNISLDETNAIQPVVEEQFHLSSMIPVATTSSDLQNSTTAPIKISDSLNVIQTDGDADTVLPDEQDTTVVSEAIVDLAYEIIISTEQTSWVKVEKLDGSKLHNDMLQPGSIVLKSDKPVHFRIGNQDNVKVVINGVEIKLAQYSRQNIADFKWPLDS